MAQRLSAAADAVATAIELRKECDERRKRHRDGAARRLAERSAAIETDTQVREGSRRQLAQSNETLERTALQLARQRR